MWFVVLAEIEERRQFLDDMEGLGRGAKYRTIIETEISQVSAKYWNIIETKISQLISFTQCQKAM